MNAKVDVNNIFIESSRLILRAYGEEDLNDFFEYASEKGVGEMAGWNHHKNIEETKSVLKMFLNERKTLAIVYKENKKVIGSIGVEYIREEMLDEEYEKLLGREIGYVLAKKYWGQGIMTEALNELIRYLFLNEKYDFLTLCHSRNNYRSQRVAEKCKFTFIKEEKIKNSSGKNEIMKVYLLENIDKNKF